MVVLGIDAHKRSHTVVAVDDVGRKLGERTIGTTTADHLTLLTWAEQLGAERLWAVEDCRHLSRRLERDPLGAAERIVRVPPKMMAQVRDSARSYGKSDPIDALAVARAALREPDLPTAHLDGAAREVRLLAGHRDDLVAERTRVINRLRWHLHELDPAWEPAARSLWRPKNSPGSTGWSHGSHAHTSSAAVSSQHRSTSSTANSNPWSTASRRPSSHYADAPPSRLRRSSARPLASSGSIPGTPSPATTAPHRSPPGRATATATGSPGSATGS